MKNKKLIGSIAEQKELAFEKYKNQVLDGSTVAELDKSTQSLVLTVMTSAYNNGWIDCQHTCIKKLSDLG